MKSNILKYFVIFYLLSLLTNASKSDEPFNFDVTNIEILENGNLFKGTGKGKITTENGIEINADNMEFRVGASDDFKISHSSSENINILRSDSPTVFRNEANNETLATFTPNGAVELYHNNSKRLETTSTGIKAYGNDHLFTTESTGDCRIILQSDSDNNAENDNSAVVFRQDGSADIGAIGVNLTNSTSIPPSQELFVAASSGESAIILATGFSNGYNNAVERVRINNAGVTTFTENVFLNKDLDVDGHTNLDNVSVAGVTTFTDDVYFDGATAGRDIIFDRSENKLNFNHNSRAEFGQGSYNTQFKSDGVNFTLVHNPITAFYLYSNTFNVIGAGNRSGNTYDNSLLSIHNGVVKLGHEIPNGGASGFKLETSTKGITVGTGVTIETNGQATFTGIVTATAFKLANGSDVGTGAGGTWSTYTAGIATSKSVGVNTSNLDDTDLTGIGNSFKGLYISNGMIVHDNVLNGNHYIGTSMNGLMAGPVTINGNLEIDGNYVVV